MRTGNKKSTFATLGASNHTDHDRCSFDYYATEPKAVELLLDVEEFEGSIWENCCGEGHLSEAMKARGYEVIDTDLIDRGYGQGGVDFFDCDKALGDNIVTNPPYIYALEWAQHSLDLLQDGKKLALLLPIRFLETQERKLFLTKNPPKKIYASSSRLLCGMNGNFFQTDKDGNTLYDRQGNPKRMSSACFYAWFVWEKGYKGDMVVDLIN